mgnify:CR=1 FL=1
MIIPDVNLLVYAHIAAFPEHAKARRWWERALNSDDNVGIALPALFGFLRLTTSPRIFQAPMPVARAIRAIERWQERPNLRLLVPGPRHLEIAFDLVQQLGTAGNLTTDIQLAALAIEHDAELHSNDADFGRFPQVRWVNPLA